MNSFISWVGGKRLLRKEIIKRFPVEGVDKYVEPLVVLDGYCSAKNRIKKKCIMT